MCPLQDLIWKKGGKQNRCDSAKLAEVKLLMILVYFVCTAIVALAFLSYTSTVSVNLYLNALLPYFTCESTGYDESKDCTPLLSEVQRPQLFDLSWALSVLYGLLPFMLFLFSTDFKLYINLMKKVTNCSRVKRT